MFGFFDWMVTAPLAELILVKESDKEKIQRLEAQLEEALTLLEEIVCVKEPDKGVVLVDHELLTYWCHEVKAWVYKHEHFSPLGEALIELHEKLKEQR